jgi:hypothetical protein
VEELELGEELAARETGLRWKAVLIARWEWDLSQKEGQEGRIVEHGMDGGLYSL